MSTLTPLSEVEMLLGLWKCGPPLLLYCKIRALKSEIRISIYSPKTQHYDQVGAAKDQNGHQVYQTFVRHTDNARSGNKHRR